MTRTFPAVLASGLVSLLIAAGGCGGDDETPPECEEIFEACHDVDPGSGPIHECHENSEEEWSRSECQENLAMCLEVCSEAEADAGVGTR
jgi:hypothetical protein